MSDLDLATILERYRGEVPPGPDGDRTVRDGLATGILDTTEENVRRNRLAADEIDDLLTYLGWNLWDQLAARSTEGESGLIPRQEYETLTFVQEWMRFPYFLEELTRVLGVDGVIDLGATPRREIGNKVNHLRIWASAVCPLIGRGIALALQIGEPWERLAEVNTLLQFMRRLQHGFWGGGPGFASARQYQVPVLDDSWIKRFCDEEIRLETSDSLAAFRRFNGATELLGFLIHFDNRAGLCDTGPYPLPDGGFMIVRDHFVNEPAYWWSETVAGLPHAVTQAMFFRPTEDIRVTINDIGTTFSQPRDYLRHLSGVAVYARDTWDTPVSEVRLLDAGERHAIERAASAATIDLYERFAAMSRRDRIMAGVHVYLREMMMPFARQAGVWDRFVDDLQFDEISPLTAQAYYPLVGGTAMQILPPLFMLGEGFVRVGERASW
jgi:hypothetical protein